MSVSYYDLLDVDEAATSDEIRAAWKSAVADLDPTDRRFRAYNDAAAVLLDADKRAAYDAELARARDQEEPAAAAEPPVAPEAAVDPGSGGEAPRTTAEPVEESSTEPATEPATEAPASEAPPTEPTTESPTEGVPTWALLLAAGAAVVSLALMIVVLSWPGSLGGDSPKSTADESSEAEAAGRAAETAAERAIPAVLGYDYRTIDEDITNAASFETEDFAAQRADFFAEKSGDGQTLRDQIVAAKAVVTAVVPSTGLTRVSPEGDRAIVVVFIDQESRKGKEAPRILRQWATLTMLEQDGNWLIDDICIEADCA